MRVLCAAALIALTGAALAEPASSEQGVITPNLREPIPNLPGKSLISVTVSYAPGARSKPHHHAKSAFIYAYVLAGQIRSQVDDGPAKVFRAGESFIETPGAHHRVSENASETEPAKLLAVFVVDSDDTALTTYDKE